MVAKRAAIYNPHIETGCDCNPHIEMGCDWTRCAGRPGGTTGNELLAACQLTVHPLPSEGRKIQMELHFFRWKLSNFYCIFNSLSVPNVSQTCKFVKKTLIRPKGPYKLIFKNYKSNTCLVNSTICQPFSIHHVFFVLKGKPANEKISIN